MLRPEHAKAKKGKFCALVRVSTDKQEVDMQIHAIKEYLNGGDHTVQWYKEEDTSGRLPFEERPVLQQAIRYARQNQATLIVYSLSRLGRRRGDVLNFFDDVISQGKIKFVCLDMPMLDETTVGFMAVLAQHQSSVIRKNTKDALKRIKAEIAEKGSYVSRAGNKIKKLGQTMNPDIAKKGGIAQAKSADKFADNFIPNIERGLKLGQSYREIAMDFNRRGFKTRRGGDWHASTIRNMIRRGERS
jgi:DNA invertase Pin-like site-specific DNA recombinase